MKYARKIHPMLLDDIKSSNKVIILYGPRQSGKTTLSKLAAEELNYKSLYINADQSKFIDILSSRDSNKIKNLITGYQLLIIDEGQRIPEIGINLKIIHDEIPDIKLLVTGSSSFLLSNKVNESLAGRKIIYTLLPISISELRAHLTPFEINEQLDKLLIYGMYPEVLKTIKTDSKRNYLEDITDSLIYKDILDLEDIKFPQKIRELLKLLAFQIGSQVSINELSQSLRINNETVERYLLLLEQSFIIFRLSAFSKNPRKEISKSRKYYFYDLGIRNALIENFNDFNTRNDLGAIWENFIISERRKKLISENQYTNSYFWRTYAGTELDYIEERNQELFAYEIKNTKPKFKAPNSWTSNYGNNYQCIFKDNFISFLE
jgi:predicted AAA+ superfamily ATPase